MTTSDKFHFRPAPSRHKMLCGRRSFVKATPNTPRHKTRHTLSIKTFQKMLNNFPDEVCRHCVKLLKKGKSTKMSTQTKTTNAKTEKTKQSSTNYCTAQIYFRCSYQSSDYAFCRYSDSKFPLNCSYRSGTIEPNIGCTNHDANLASLINAKGKMLK